MAANQRSDHVPDGTPVLAKYPGKLYDKETFFPAVIVSSAYQVRPAQIRQMPYPPLASENGLKHSSFDTVMAIPSIIDC